MLSKTSAVLLLLLVVLGCNNKELQLLKVYEKDYKEIDAFYGEVYASAKGDFYNDTTLLKSACEKLAPTISTNYTRIKFHIRNDDKTVKRVTLDCNELNNISYTFSDCDSANRGFARTINKLIENKVLTLPDNLVGVWNVHGWAFTLMFKVNDQLMTDTYHYDGTKQRNLLPEVIEVTLNDKKLLKHTWQSDLMGPDEHFYEINEFGDLIYYEPHDFMQYIFERIDL
jgi:hypothetical protein